MAKKKEQKKKKEKEKVSKKQLRKQNKIIEPMVNEAQDLYFLAKIDGSFLVAKATQYRDHAEWLRYKFGIDEEIIKNQILGYIKGKKIVIFNGKDRTAINRKDITFENVVELHNICRDNIGIGNYKIYNGIRTDKETGKSNYIGTILDFDVRKPVKKDE